MILLIILNFIKTFKLSNFWFISKKSEMISLIDLLTAVDWQTFSRFTQLRLGLRRLTGLSGGSPLPPSAAGIRLCRCTIVVRILEKCDDDSCWIFFFLIDCWLLVFWAVSIFHLCACCHHAYRRLYIDLSHSIHETSLTIKESLVEHETKCRRSREVKLTILFRSRFISNKNHDYWMNEALTCVIYSSWSSLAFIRRIDSENSSTRESTTFFVFTSRASIVIEVVS